MPACGYPAVAAPEEYSSPIAHLGIAVKHQPTTAALLPRLKGQRISGGGDIHAASLENHTQA